MASRRVSVTIDADVSPFNRGLMSASASTRTWVNELESADSRMAALVQTGLALAPALVPIGAAAVPAIAGLTTQLGFAVAAGGTAMLAFQGVGDALGALNDFQIEPTGKNLEKLNEKLDAIGPAGEVFVRQLQEIRPELQALQDVAGENMFPGIVAGIDSLFTQAPRVEKVVASIASALGGLAEDAGADLAGPEWSEFFDYMAREAGPTLEAMGKSVGNLVEGITNMVMAFDPLSDDFTAGMLDMSEAFVRWSDNLDSSQSFQEFVDYVRESGPQAMETLGSISSALIEFVEAAAPVGAVVLPVLETMADALGAVADSPAGPVIVGAAAAVGTLGRSLALLSAVGLRGGGDSLVGKIFAAEKIKDGVAAMRQGQQSLYNITTASERAEMGATKLAAANERQAVAESKRVAAMKAGAVQFSKNAAAIGGLALMTSGAADGMGLTNTASMALMGTLAGPWGAAVGGGVGLLLDMKAAGNESTEALSRLDAALSSFDPSGLQKIQGELADVRADYADAMDVSGVGDFFGDVSTATFGANSTEFEAAIKRAEDQAQSVRDAFAVVAMSLGESFEDAAGRSMLPTLEQLGTAAERARPAMEALGITAEDLAEMDATELQSASGAIADWTTHADSAAGRTEAVAEAFRGLDNELVDTATSAEILEGTLDALLGPGMNLSAATDAWRGGLRNLNEELDENNRSLFANTDAADQNRGVFRARVGDLHSLLVAEANAGASAGALSKKLRTQREALLDAGAAAGINRGELNKLLNDLGLTPKMVKTIMKLEAQEAENKAEHLRARLDKLNAMKPSPKVDAKIDAAEAALAKVLAYLGRVNGTTATTYVKVRTVNEKGFGPQADSALGNIFPAVMSYAYGDVANNHQPELAGPGITRIWREPETQGEAYIPLANDHRRPRARDILEETAGLLGARSVEWYANGGKSGKDKDKKKVRKPDLMRDTDGDAVGTDFLRQGLLAAQALASSALIQVNASEILMGAADDQMKAAEDNVSAAEKALAIQEQLYDGLKEAASSQFSRSLTGGGLSGLDRTLTADIGGGSAMDATMKALVTAGLDATGPAAGLFQELISSNDLRTSNELLAAGPDAIAHYERQFAQRAAINAGRGTFAADSSYGATVAAAQSSLALMQEQLGWAKAAQQQTEQRLDAAIAKLGAIETAVGASADRFGQVINNAAAAGGRANPRR